LPSLRGYAENVLRDWHKNCSCDWLQKSRGYKMKKEDSRKFCIELLKTAEGFSIASGQTLAESLLLIVTSLGANLDAQILEESEAKDSENS
jgi:hypothetical protein